MIKASDDRAKAILNWLTNDLNLDITQFEPASSDASFRRYFRVQQAQQTFIVMDAPPDKEETAPFIDIAQLFSQAQVNVPDILQKNTEQGFLLLEDFGSTCLLDSLTESTAPSLYSDALTSLITLQKNINTQTCSLPHYDAPLLHRELSLFTDWFLTQHCQLALTNQQESTLNHSYQYLINSALQQTQVCVHRDYHSRNLMHLPQNNPGIIDFQDAVIGPITYDAVSLLRDCYINWPDEKIKQFLAPYYQQLKQENLINCSAEQFQHDFDLMGIQRHLKAVGIFARLNLRDRKSVYLEDIPRTLNYVTNISQRYSELQDFHDFLAITVLPAYQRTRIK